MSSRLLCLIPLLLMPMAGDDASRLEERRCFQTAGPWTPRVHVDADVAIVYGIGPRMPANVRSWRERGYRVHLMTGVAWGSYQDYLYGRWDGTDHWDQAQTDRNGKRILHGGNAEVPYISPGAAYGRYLCEGVKRALEAGVEAVHLEEPEFWARGGYEENFKREWRAYYGEDWQAPHSSHDAQYRSSKLKYFLYRRALTDVFAFVRDYNRRHNTNVRCYVPTHSLINYAHWRIVSPESSLIDAGADGYIAQVWTGTARTPNVHAGVRRERTFESAFLEYGAMQNLARASGRRIWYLNDPIEDNPNHSWDDYRTNWESTLVASLLQPDVHHYEILPWPDRIYTHNYPAREVKSGERVEKIPIPKAYETELQTVFRALGDMKQPDGAVRWLHRGTAGVGVLVSDTMMFQREAPDASDKNLGSFYGLALPLLAKGVPVEPVQIESARTADYLRGYKMLLLTYEGQKPPSPAFHKTLAEWVRAGGALVVVDDDGDPYNRVREWWNAAPLAFRAPRQHLFETLGLTRDATGAHRVGKGMVLRAAASPAALSYAADGATRVLALARQAAEAVKREWRESPALVLQRGPYVVAAGLVDSAVLQGRFVDLFDANLAVLGKVELASGARRLLFDLDTVKSAQPVIAAASCRIRSQRFENNVFEFEAEGQAETNGVVRVVFSGKRISEVENAQVGESANGTALLRFANSPERVKVRVRFQP